MISKGVLQMKKLLLCFSVLLFLLLPGCQSKESPGQNLSIPKPDFETKSIRFESYYFEKAYTMEIPKDWIVLDLNLIGDAQLANQDEPDYHECIFIADYLQNSDPNRQEIFQSLFSGNYQPYEDMLLSRDETLHSEIISDITYENYKSRTGDHIIEVSYSTQNRSGEIHKNVSYLCEETTLRFVAVDTEDHLAMNAAKWMANTVQECEE